MDSPAGVEHESTHITPDSAVQEIAQDYSNQWHILEQLKSSVAVVDPQAETSNREDTNLTPQSHSSSQLADNRLADDKAGSKDWYLLPETASSGHSSETEADSALEISDLRNNPDVSYNSNKSPTPKSNTQSKESLNKESLYQEQWHVLEELKASVKAMQWGSDSSLDISHQREHQSRSNSKIENFVELHKRSPAGSSIGSSGSSNNGLQDTVKASNSQHSQEQSPLDLQFYIGTSLASDNHLESRNTSTDLSLESENLGFAELPNRPATIGNYGASDGSTYPFGGLSLQSQPLGLPQATSPFNTNISPLVGSPLVLVHDNDGMLSKSPMSARERLQPDGRDGPDVISAPPPVQQNIPVLVSYPLSAGSSNNSSGASSQPSINHNDFASVGSFVGGLDSNQSTSSNGTTALGAVNNGNLPSGMALPAPSQYLSRSNNSLENIKEGQTSLLSSWQPSGGSPNVNAGSFQNDPQTSKDTSITWLSPGGSEPVASVMESDLPGDDIDSKRSSVAHDELREAVLQRIEDHTHIPGFNMELGDAISNSEVQSDDGRLSVSHSGKSREMTLTAYPQTSLDDSSSKEATSIELSKDKSNLSNASSLYSEQQENSHGSSHSTPVALDQDKSYATHRSSSYSYEHYKSTTTTANSEYSRPSVFPNAQYMTYPLNGESGSELNKPSLLGSIKKGLVSDDYEQSPVSKLLGPNFKSTQDYLNKLKNDRLIDSSIDTTSSTVQNSHKEIEQPSGSLSQSSSISENNYRPRKDAWSEYERTFKATNSDFVKDGESSGEQSILKNASPSQTFDVSKSVTSFSPSLTSFSYSNSIVRGTGLRGELEVGGDVGRSARSSGLYSMPLTDNSPMSPISYTPMSCSESKVINDHKSSDIPIRAMSGQLVTSKEPLSASEGPSLNEIHMRYSDRYGSETQSSLASKVKDFSVTSDYDTISRPRDQEPKVPTIESTKPSSFSSYDTPLTRLRDKKTMGGEARNLRYSVGSSVGIAHADEAEDTDDLLSYEAVLEGDIKYFKNLPTSTNFHSSSINSKADGITPTSLTRDISVINGSVDHDPLWKAAVRVNSTGMEFTNNDEQTKRYHLSLGAGEVRPVEDYGKAVSTLEAEESDGSLSSDALEIEDYEEDDQKKDGYLSDRNTSAATESSSSSIYQPYLPIALRQPPSTERDSELTGNSSSTFGVYDIRQSSGPGSTNRRRKAMGLSPIPGRAPKPKNGVVYVSGDSSPLSVPEDASADEKSKNGKYSREDTTRDSSKDSLGSVHRYHSERSRTSSRSSRNNRHLEEERPRSSSKEGSYRTRSRESSAEEAKIIDDYIGGRKAVPQTRPKTARSRNASHSDESQSSREFRSKNVDLNQMWERFQESLKSSPRSKSDDSVSSHLSRLSALLSKPIDIITTSSEAESEQFRKPRSHSYASSSSDVSTESDQPYHPISQQNYSLTKQIQLRKLLETVNIADVPTFPSLRHRDTTTTSSTQSDTSTSEVPLVHVNLPRSNRGTRKVSKTPVLEPFVQTKPRPADIGVKPKCICAVKSGPKHSHDFVERKKQAFVDEKSKRRPQTFEVGVNVPSPNVPGKKPVRSKKGYVDVGVQTKRDSDDDSIIQMKRKDDKEKHRRKDKTISSEASSQNESGVKSGHRRKERHIASQNSPGKSPPRTSSSRSKERHIASQNFTRDSSRLSDESFVDDWPEQPSGARKDRSFDKHHKERSQHSPHSKHKSHHSTLDTSGPSWFYPVSNRHYSRPSPSLAVRPSKLLYDEQTVKTFSPPSAPPSNSMQKLSLQDAFFFAKPDFVKRSRARLSRIERNKVVRENGESKEMSEDRVSKMEIPANKPIASKPQPNPRTEKLHRPKPRQISKKEMKTLNLKLYNNLPEVKAKKADDKRANFYKSNRLRAKLFDKRVRENLKKRYAA